MREFRIILRNIKIKKKNVMHLLALLVFSLTLYYSFQYSKIPEPEEGTIRIDVEDNKNDSLINNLVIRIRIHDSGTYILFHFDSYVDAKIHIEGIINECYLEKVYVKEIAKKVCVEEATNSKDLINIGNDNLGKPLDEKIWRGWIKANYYSIVIPSENTGKDIIFKFSSLKFKRRIALSIIINHPHEGKSYIALQAKGSHSVINIPLHIQNYELDKFYFEMENSLSTTFDILKIMPYDKINWTLFAVLSAIAFFAYSLYLTRVSGNEIKESVEKDLKESSKNLDEKSNDLQKRIDELTKEQKQTIIKMDDLGDKQEELKKGIGNLDKKIINLNKRQTRRKSRR